jgi:hypothetical protein
VHSLEPEVRTLLREGAIDDALAARPIALESRALFSLHALLLVVLYGAVAAIVTGVGLVIRDHLDRIGPVTLIAGIAAVAAGCYLPALRAAWRGTRRRLVADYLLLLGALLVSADLGYAELQFHLLGDHWSRHLLLLAALHAGTAYALDSRLVLSVALTAFAGWLGVEPQLGSFEHPRHALLGAGWRSLGCALLLLGARRLHRRLVPRLGFGPVYESFAANLGFWGALALLWSADTRWTGAALLAGITVAVARIGLRRPQERLVLWAIGYGSLGLCWLEGVILRDPLIVSTAVLATLVAAVVLLWNARSRLRDAAS